MILFYFQVYVHRLSKNAAKNDEVASNITVNDIHNLQNQSLLKSQLQKLVDSLIDDKSHSSSSDTFKQLKHCFDEIDDITYLLDIGSLLCQHDLQYKLLLESLCIRVKEDCNIVKKIDEILSKTDILKYIQLVCYDDRYNTNFILKSDLVQICITLINNGDLDLASMAWLKLCKFYINVTAEDIISILNATPHNIKMNSFILWLKNFIPSILEENPFYIDLFVKWTTERVFSFEKSPYWPKMGIKFIEEVLSVLEISQSNFIPIRPTAMDDLDLLITNITKIYELKEKYKINILLKELSCLSSTEIALIKLQRCYTEDLDVFLHNYLTAFTSENLLELDDILRTHIERETSDSGGRVDETRLRIILNAFHTNNTKLQCLLDVLRILDVPWTSAMHDLSIFCINMHEKEFTICEADLQLVHDIKMEINFSNLKVVLKKYNFPLNTTDYLLVLHKIVSADDVNLKDLKTVMQSTSGYTNYGSVLYINRCLKDCLVKKSLDYFNTLPLLVKNIILKSIITKYEFLINDVASSSMIERSYLDFIKGTHALDHVKINKIEDMYHLKNSFKINTSLNEMSCETQRINKINEWFVHSDEGAATGRGACVSRLARLPGSFMTTIVDLLSQTSASTKVQYLIESFILIFTKININSVEIEMIKDNFRALKNSVILWDSCQILVHLLCNCPEEYLHLLTSVLTLFSAIVNTSVIVNHLTIAWKFHYVFVPMSNISSTDNLMSLIVDLLLQQDFYQNFPDNVCYHKNDFVPFRVLSLCTYRHLLLDTHPNQYYVKNKEYMAKGIVSNILLSQECDELLLAGSLLLLNSIVDSNDNNKQIWMENILEEYGENINCALSKYLAYPIMQRALSLKNSMSSEVAIVAPYHILKTKYNLNFADLALPDITEDTWDATVVLYYVLKNYPDTTLQRLLDYCQTLNVDIDDGLSLQFISQLVGWELNYTRYTDDWHTIQMNYENDEKDLIDKCSPIWNSIRNKSFLIDILKDFWRKGEVSLHGRLVSINPYYYEIYLCIFKLLEKHADWLNVNEYSLICFLKEYKRTSAPKQYEFELFSVKGIFPEIGHYRLPFQLFMREDMWSNLKSEITLATYERWLPIVALLNLDSDLQIACDMLCSNALKQTMTSRKRNTEIKDDKNNETWRLEAKEEPLLRAAHRCVRHIANMEWAAACLFYVLQGCARGADQVAAAQLCYHFAQRWAAIQPANRAVRQMEKLHGTLSTRHALHKVDWACEDLLRFVAEPVQLIRAIYFHPAFINKMTRYNVNKTVDEIADKNNINISSIRIQILENILEQKIDEKREKDVIGLNKQDLMRAKYILKATCSKMSAMYLARIALDDESDFNKKKKIRAFQCLISIVEPDTALKVTNKARESLWYNLIELYFAIRLEKADMPWAIATFEKDKLRTLEQVYAASENSTDGLYLAAELTVRYGTEHNSRNIIPRLITSEMYDILSKLLRKTFITPDNFIRNAWRAIILSPFLHADYPITDRQRQNCLNAINMLPLCSCLNDEDLNILWKNCIRIKCYSIACLTLPFMSLTARQTLSELKKIDKRSIIAGLKNLQTDTYLINGALAVIESVNQRKNN